LSEFCLERSTEFNDGGKNIKKIYLNWGVIPYLHE